MKRVWYSTKIKIKSPDVVHHILMFGNLKDIQSLKAKLGKKTIKEFFLRYPKKIYSASTLNFVKNFILGLTTPIDEQKYLKNTPRNIR